MDNTDYDSGTFYEQYLTRVFQYINYWLNDTRLAEKLTLKVLKETLLKYNGNLPDEEKFSTTLFAGSRKEIQAYLRSEPVNPSFSGLSTQEKEVISLKLCALLNNRSISKLLGLSELMIGRIVHRSLCRLETCVEA